jgi:hypothetical protein
LFPRKKPDNSGEPEIHSVSTKTTKGGGFKFVVETTIFKPDKKEIAKYEAFGIPWDAVGPNGRSADIRRILRPIDHAISKTFKNRSALSEEDEFRLQVALNQWEYLQTLPRYGPWSTWEELGLDRNDRDLTKEERASVTYIAYQNLDPAVFLSLVSNGVKKYKDELDGYARNAKS